VPAQIAEPPFLFQHETVHGNAEPFAGCRYPMTQWEFGDCCMTSFRPSKIEQFAIEAKLNRFFGANIYDRLFLGFEVVEVVEDKLHAWSPSEHCAAVIDHQLGARVAWIAQSVFNRPIRQVSVLVRGLSHNGRAKPV